ncbi:MAG: hypothetical protein WC637_13890 [Victivallales bacterium]|jgi:antitoxin component YwqK of YwqJK toxin-antitoxin module
MKLRSVIKYFIWIIVLALLSIYFATYFILRHEQVSTWYRFYDKVGDVYEYGTLFDENKTNDKALFYIFSPLGYADWRITGHKYWLSNETYLYHSVDSNEVKAYIANKNKTNNKTTYEIVFDDNSKKSGSLGYLNDAEDAFKIILKKNPLLEGKNGIYTLKVESLTGLEGKVTTTLELEFKNGIPHGLYTVSMFIYGKIININKITYKNGVKDGEYIKYGLGKEIATGFLKNDKADGKWIFHHELSDNVSCNANFINGKIDGLLTMYNTKGEIISEGTYKDGKPLDGTFVKDISSILLYHPNHPDKITIDKYESGNQVSSTTSSFYTLVLCQ